MVGVVDAASLGNQVGHLTADEMVAVDDALELVLGLLSPPRQMELALEAVELYIWDRAGSDN